MVCAECCHMAPVFAVMYVYVSLSILLKSGIDKSDGMVDDTSISLPHVLFFFYPIKLSKGPLFRRCVNDVCTIIYVFF